jgi:hypothetical protein
METPTIFEIRSMRDTILQLIEDMEYKATICKDNDIAYEVSYALYQTIGASQDALGTMTALRTNDKTAAA